MFARALNVAANCNFAAMLSHSAHCPAAVWLACLGGERACNISVCGVPSMSKWARPQHWQQYRAVAAAAAVRRDARASRYAGIMHQGTASPADSAAAAAAASQPPPASTSPHPSLPTAPVEPSVLSIRQWLFRLTPLQQFKAVGVSFEDRQSLIPHLHKDQGVACVREPNNPHDPHAVAIQTLDGHGLGYIPRDKTAHFMQDLCFGFVSSAGQQGSDGLWGFYVLVQPTLPPVEVHAFPISLTPHVSLGMQLDGERWQQVKQATLAAAQGRCEVTAAPRAAVHERWQFDEERRVVRLVGFRAEAPEVQQIGGLLQLDPGAAEGATELLRQLNAWSEEDVRGYLQQARALQQQRSRQQWQLDLGLLGQLGVPVPPALQHFCV